MTISIAAAIRRAARRNIAKRRMEMDMDSGELLMDQLVDVHQKPSHLVRKSY
jgi:hypothetical protein